MMKAVLALMTVVCLSGCAVEASYPQPEYGDTEYCDADGNCRDIQHVMWYYGPAGEVIYYDTAFGCWMGRGGYYSGGVWVAGWPNGYRARYGGSYHPYHGGFHGNGFHSHGGSFHGGGGFHGGHGGRR